MRNIKNLRTLYLSGLTIRQIAAQTSVCHTTVLYHLRKSPSYHGMVTSILISRVLSAERSYTITRTRTKLRRLKLTLAVLRQRRPEVYADLIERSRLRSCPDCSRPVAARLRANLWAWQCRHCGSGGFAKMDLSGALAAMQQEVKEAVK